MEVNSKQRFNMCHETHFSATLDKSNQQRCCLQMIGKKMHFFKFQQNNVKKQCINCIQTEQNLKYYYIEIVLKPNTESTFQFQQ